MVKLIHLLTLELFCPLYRISESMSCEELASLFAILARMAILDKNNSMLYCRGPDSSNFDEKGVFFTNFFDFDNFSRIYPIFHHSP